MSSGLRRKKKAARTFCCSCREASDANYFQLWCGRLRPLSITGISTRYYRFTSKQIQKSKFSRDAGHETFDGKPTSNGILDARKDQNSAQLATGSRMTNSLKSSSSGEASAEPKAGGRGVHGNGWLKMGAIAAASAVLGGMAAAWFYRKTLTQLREAENEIPDPESRIIEDETGEDF